MAKQNLVIIGSSNGLVPAGTKPLPKPMLTNHQNGPVAFIWGGYTGKISINDKSVKITTLMLQLHLPVAPFTNMD